MNHNDPLKSTGAEHELFTAIGQLVNNKPSMMVASVGVNLIVNAIRQSITQRAEAERIFDELFGRGKSVLLDKHYDPVTGLKRTVFPFTQVAQAPFHQETN